MVGVLAGCGGGGGSDKADNTDKKRAVPVGAVAVVGDQTIPKDELQTVIDQARLNYRQQKRPFPKQGTPSYTRLRQQAVAYLVQQAELEQGAQDLGIEITDAQVDARRKQIVRQSFQGNEKRFLDRLRGQGLTDRELRQDVIRPQLVAQAASRRVGERVKVTDEEIRSYYEKNRQLYRQPPSRTIRHILVRDEALADRIHGQLEGGADFAALARKYSRDRTSRGRGGRVRVSRNGLIPQFDRAAFALRQGQLSKPVRTAYGYEIIQALSATKPAQDTPLALVRTVVRQRILVDKRTKAYTAWFAKTRKRLESTVLYAPAYRPKTSSTGTGSTTSTGATTSP